MAGSEALTTTSRIDFRALALIVLRGIGQVMLQEHAGTGLCFLAGLAVASPLMLLGAVLGAVIGPATAYLASFDRKEIEQGLYGFNSTLVGIAVLTLLKPTFLAFALLVVGCVVSTLVMRLMMRYLGFPAYTAPFVATTWAVLILSNILAGPDINAPPTAAPPTLGGFTAAVLRGESEIMLGANAATGVLFLIGLALSNPWHAAVALLGSASGTALAIYHGDPSEQISLGLFGYNAALSAIALFIRRRSLGWPILAALLSTVMTEFFPKWGDPALTAPFVAAAWIGLAVIWVEDRLFGERR